MNYDFVADIKNTWARRTAIGGMLILGLPIIAILLILETSWKTIQAVGSIIKEQYKVVKPSLKDLVAFVKEIW
jgi:hypothetical protein